MDKLTDSQAKFHLAILNKKPHPVIKITDYPPLLSLDAPKGLNLLDLPDDIL